MAANQPIIVKKVKKVAGGHHGGAWKVAYADFVTAMMAFFLLMWLINTTSPEQKRGIADYFAPASLSATTSGAGGILAGTALGESGALQQGATPMVDAPSTPTESSDGEGGQASNAQMSAEELAEAQKEASDFEAAELSIRQALQDLPELAELSHNVIVDQTPEGLRIQLVDQEGRPMFNPASAEPTESAKLLLRAAARVTLQLPNQIIITGHTDAAPNPDSNNSNWELSAARANAARKVLMNAGLPEARIAQITGKAGLDPLFPDDPYQAANRRIAVILKRAAPPLPSNGGF